MTDGISTEEPIRFLGGTFHDQPSINKHMLHGAFLRFDDLIGDIPFTIRTDLLFMNNHGSRKLFQLKLDIQHYDAVIEHVPEKVNIPADVFSRLIILHQTLPLFDILTLQYSPSQRELIHRFHTHLYAQSKVDRTISLLTQ